jgi:signal transduction histidine kinase
MNVMNYASAVKETDEILELLSHNKGRFPNPEGNKGDKLPLHMSPELPYETRFFTVLTDKDGTILQCDTDRIAAVDDILAAEYGQKAMKAGEDHGFIKQYRFCIKHEEKSIRIIFLDAGRTLDSMKTFFFSGILMAIVGYLAAFAMVVLASKKIVRPIAESYEKQKRFITDAGHEIKTPLAIISANTDLLEMDVGKHDSLEEVRNQTKRLTMLTNDLVYLAKMEETDRNIPLMELPISDVVEEAASPFRVLAQKDGKKFDCSIQPLLFFKGNKKALEQLVCILLDNATKYSPAGGHIQISLEKRAKSILLTVCNTSAAEIPRDALPHLFDRFFRTDASRNSQTGGHGIGLSLAYAIVQAHGGKICAETDDGNSLQITVTLPI